MRSVLTVIAAIALLLTLAGPTSAHHSFSAEFDANKQVNLTGEVVMVFSAVFVLCRIQLS